LVYQRSTSGGHTTRGYLRIFFAFATYGQVYPHLVHNPLDVATIPELPSARDRSDYFVGEGYIVHISPGQVLHKPKAKVNGENRSLLNVTKIKNNNHD
jgi:hypothetical protein